jgi:hypothetical protein
MNRNMIIAITVIVAAVLLSFGAWYFLGPGPVFASESASVIIGNDPTKQTPCSISQKIRAFLQKTAREMTEIRG